MKKLFAIMAIGAFAACNDTTTTGTPTDSIKVENNMMDTSNKMMDTTNKMMDSTKMMMDSAKSEVSMDTTKKM